MSYDTNDFFSRAHSDNMLVKMLAMMLTAVTAVCAQSYGIVYGGHTYGVVRSYGHTRPFAYSSVYPGGYVAPAPALPTFEPAVAPTSEPSVAPTFESAVVPTSEPTQLHNSTRCHCRPRWVGKLLCKSAHDTCVCFEKWIEREFCK